MMEETHKQRTYRLWYPYSGKRRLLNASKKVIHASGDNAYMNTILTKLEHIKELSAEMKMHLRQISDDIALTEKYLKESCPISYWFKVNEEVKLVWDSNNILVVSGRKGNTPLIEVKWPLRVKYYRYLGPLLDKIINELEGIVSEEEEEITEPEEQYDREQRPIS